MVSLPLPSTAVCCHTLLTCGDSFRLASLRLAFTCPTTLLMRLGLRPLAGSNPAADRVRSAGIRVRGYHYARNTGVDAQVRHFANHLKA